VTPGSPHALEPEAAGSAMLERDDDAPPLLLSERDGGAGCDVVAALAVRDAAIARRAARYCSARLVC